MSMEIEFQEDDRKYNPPKKDGFENLVQLLSSTHGYDFLHFQSNAYDYIASGMTEAIPTGIPILPSLYSQQILEIVGRYGTAKSVIAYMIIAHVVAPKIVGGMEQQVIIFDLDHKLSLANLVRALSTQLVTIENAEKRSQELFNTAGRITIYQPRDLSHFSLLVESLRDNIAEFPRLILVDSLSAYIYDLGSSLSFYQATFHRAMKTLTAICRSKKASIVVVSPETLKQSPNMFYFPSNAWGCHIHHQLHCRRFHLLPNEDSSNYSRFSVSEVGNRENRCQFCISAVDMFFEEEQTSKKEIV